MKPETKQIMGTVSIMLGLILLTLPLAGWRRCAVSEMTLIGLECFNIEYGVCALPDCSKTVYNAGNCTWFGTGCSPFNSTLSAVRHEGDCILNAAGICVCNYHTMIPTTISTDTC